MKRPTLRLASQAEINKPAPEALELFEIVLPNRHDQTGHSYHNAHLLFQQRALEIAAGYTLLTDSGKGAWVSPEGKIARELVSIYRVATTASKWQRIVAEALRLFDKEQSLFTTRAGVPRFYNREAQNVE